MGISTEALRWGFFSFSLPSVITLLLLSLVCFFTNCYVVVNCYCCRRESPSRKSTSIEK